MVPQNPEPGAIRRPPPACAGGSVIVVPCYNEERRLDREAFREFLSSSPDPIFLLFVDDGSRDGTRQMLADLEAYCPERARLLPLAANAGKAEAVRRGMLQAIDWGPDSVGFWDADLATPLSTIAEFRALLATRPDSDWIFGSRVKMLGRKIDRRPLRHYLGRVFATATSVALDLGIYDSQCGAKLFRVNDPLRAVLAEPFRSRWIFDVEMLARLTAESRAGRAPLPKDCVYEAALTRWEDVAGSKVKARDFVRASVELAAIWRRHLRA